MENPIIDDEDERIQDRELSFFEEKTAEKFTQGVDHSTQEKDNMQSGISSMDKQ